MADEEVEGEHVQSIRDTPDRDRDPSASALTRLKDDRAHAGVENGARPKEIGQSVTVIMAHRLGPRNFVRSQKNTNLNT